MTLRTAGGSGVPWLVAAPLRALPLLSVRGLVPCVSVSDPPLPSLVKTPIVGFRTQPHPV